jgi:hypothetical protein
MRYREIEMLRKGIKEAEEKSKRDDKMGKGYFGCKVSSLHLRFSPLKDGFIALFYIETWFLLHENRSPSWAVLEGSSIDAMLEQ